MGVENGLTIYSREDKHGDKNDFPENLCKTKQCFWFFSGFKGIWWKEKTVEGGTYGVRNVFMK